MVLDPSTIVTVRINGKNLRGIVMVRKFKGGFYTVDVAGLGIKVVPLCDILSR